MHKNNIHFESDDSQEDKMKRLDDRLDNEVGADEYMSFYSPKKYIKKQFRKIKEKRNGHN